VNNNDAKTQIKTQINAQRAEGQEQGREQRAESRELRARQEKGLLACFTYGGKLSTNQTEHSMALHETQHSITVWHDEKYFDVAWPCFLKPSA
jgi:hypothetical protein